MSKIKSFVEVKATQISRNLLSSLYVDIFHKHIMQLEMISWFGRKEKKRGKECRQLL
jgi:hypothetical protein